MALVGIADVYWSAPTPFTSTRSVARSKGTPRPRSEVVDLAERRPRGDEGGEGHVARRAANGLEVNVGQRRSSGLVVTGLR